MQAKKEVCCPCDKKSRRERERERGEERGGKRRGEGEGERLEKVVVRKVD